MATDKAKIINWALTDLGIGPIFSSDDGSDLSQQVENTWERTVVYAFGLDNWHWANKTVPLARQAATPINGYRYGFDLPGDRIGTPETLFYEPGRKIRNFTIEGSTVFANETTAYARCKLIIAVEDWPPEWTSAFVKLLAANLAMPIQSDNRRREELQQEALGQPHEQGRGGMFGRLMAQNLAAQPIESPLDGGDPLSDARHSSADPYMSWAGRYA